MTQPLLPLARKLGEKLGDNVPEIPEVQMIVVKPTRLDPNRWGFRNRAEMDAAFAGEEGE